MNRDNILFLINPKSKNGNATKIWKNACKKYTFLQDNPVDITKINIASTIETMKPKLVVMTGGDGTIT